MFKNKIYKIKVHFVGIGGIGMSGIAQILLQMGVQVSGSDMREGPITQNLKKLGAEIFIGHRPENVNSATVVVYSSAVSFENPEMVMAQKMGIPQIKRAEMLSELMRLKYGIAVAGTHGKTTTTSFLGTILYECQLDPTLIIGGVVENLKGNARIGKGEVLVAEADESDGSFLLLGPIMSIITNIDDDHLDYHGNWENLMQAFTDFANRIPFYGCCALNVHDPHIQQLKKRIKRPWVNFGLGDEGDAKKFKEKETIDYEARNIALNGREAEYDLFHMDEFVHKIRIYLPGRHNVLNSLGAMAIAHQMGLGFPEIAKAVEKFKGVGRRFETLFQEHNFQIVDDYAHHPTEISTTLTAAKLQGFERLVVLFEPHRYSRSQRCWKDYLHCFNLADEIFISSIYAASEKEIPGVTGERLVMDINELHPGQATYLDSMENLEELFRRYRGTSTLFLTLGAGSIGRRVREAVRLLKENGN